MQFYFVCRSQDCACLDIFDIVIIEVPEVQSLLLIDKRCSRTSGVKLILKTHLEEVKNQFVNLEDQSQS